jgi:catechol 2,3-dioxygenase-like lactoylglutathione lyase family enzyme
MIIDHIGLAVNDYQRSKEFYSKALAPLNIRLLLEVENAAGFGREGKPDFWFGVRPGTLAPVHVGFVAESRREVRQFYEAALSAGGKDNGPPGVREIYHPDYYGAFVLDPDGNNIEAVCHLPE